MLKILRNAVHYLGLCCLLTLIAPAFLLAQSDQSDLADEQNTPLTAAQSRFLQNFARERALTYQLERDSAIRLAVQNGLPVHGKAGDGSFSLQGFDGSGQLRYYASDNAMSAAVLGSGRLHQGVDLGPAVTGAGFILDMWEVGRPLLSHVEFGGRVVQYDNSNIEMSNHANHVGGTMIAAGQNASARGMAYQANLRAYDANNDIAEIANAAQAYNLRVSNHSYGPACGWQFNQGESTWYWWGNTNISQTTDFKFGLYDSDARDIDQITYNAPFYLPVFSAGNDRNDAGPPPGTQHMARNSANEWVLSTATRSRDGDSQGYDCLPPSKTAKNALVVGAVEAETDGDLLISSMSDFSSWGPTDDGRIKPDVVSRGVDVFSAGSQSNTHYYNSQGTSMAAPSVAGSLALLLQHYSNTSPGFSIRASALKALVIHTASDGDGPDYSWGWGLVNVYKAAEHISRHISAESTARLTSRDSLTNGSQRDRLYYHDGLRPFVATLVWTDPAGPLSANTLNPTTSRLVHDLDMRLISEATGTTYRPWVLNPAIRSADAFKGDNFRDNVEQIYEENLPPGLYRLRITHKGNLQQPQQYFSLVVSGRTNLHTACSGSISDGSEDDNYLNETDYSWTIQPSEASSITLNFDRFDTEANFDFVRIYDGDSPQADLIGEFSGISLPPAVTATSGTMFVQFTTDESVRRPGWSASYSCAQCDPPLNVAANGVTSESATISWTASPGAASYTLRLRIQGGSTWTTQQWSTTSAFQSGLQAATTYELQIQANCGGELSAFTESVFFTTAAATCNAPTTSEISHSMVTVNTAQLATTISATLFQFRYRPQSSSTWNTLPESSANTAMLSGLQSATTYEYQLRRRCANAVWSNWSGSRLFTTTAVSMDLQPSAVSQGASPSVTTVSLMTNCNSWSVTNIPAWVSISPQSGSGDATLSINFQANTTNAERTAVINIVGCSLNRTITLSQQACTLPSASPAVSLTGNPLICDGQSVSLVATGSCNGCTVVWSNGLTGSSIAVSTPGQYTAFFRNNCGDGPGAAAITINAANAPQTVPVITATATTLCSGQSVSLVASGNCSGCTVVWSNGLTGSSVAVSTPGQYTAFFRNNCGDGPGAAAITINAANAPQTVPVITATATTLCSGQSVSLVAAGNCSGCTVIWSNGLSGPSIAVSTPGQYTAFFRNNCGDGPGAAAITINAASAPQTAPVITVIGNTQLCAGQTTTLFASGSCPGCTLLWSNGQTGSSIQVQSAGAYFAYFLNNCGEGPASAVTSVTTDVIYVPAVDVNNQCFLAAPNGTNYQWYLNNQPITEATGQFWMAQVTGYYTLSMTNPAGCTGTSAPLFVNACTTADDEPQEKLLVELFPNPASDRLWLRYSGSGLLTEVRLDLYSLDGRWLGCVLQQDQLQEGNVQEVTLLPLPAGTYYYKFWSAQAARWGNIVITP